MALMLGIDTGGTYTDAVIHDDAAPAPGILAKAKALTSHENLAVGIGQALGAVLAQSAVPAGEIGLVSISTTLATNALVEGRGGRVCLVLIGFDAGALDRAGLGAALGSDPVIWLAGGHTPTGDRQAPLDTAPLIAALEADPDVAAFAVVAHFGTRNPEDEIAVRDLIATRSGGSITCGHELAASLGGPKRALTCLLNARLIHMIADLIAATEQVMTGHGVGAPLMLVRGDGTLVSAAFAGTRPIETILSGPAASLVGAAHLTGARDAVVSDIGGTTTDIAILRDGHPGINPNGATVGGHATMVEAVDMRTFGLGGDSEVHVDESSLTARITLGPRRLIPLSLLAVAHGDRVLKQLETDLGKAIPGRYDARFLMRGPASTGFSGLGDSDRTLLQTLAEEPLPLADVITSRPRAAALNRLSARGFVRIAGFTPSDAAHVVGRHGAWDADAALLAARLMARKRTASGRDAAPDGETFSRWVIDRLERRSAEILLDTALDHDGLALREPALSPLGRAALDGHRGAARIRLGLDLPLIGLGASAPVYYPAIAGLLGTDSLIPEHADVANAIGAVAGQVRIQRRAEISQPAEGRFRVHLGQPADFSDLDAARCHAQEVLSREARDMAEAAGAADVALLPEWTASMAEIEGRQVFVQGEARVTATGRPRLV